MRFAPAPSPGVSPYVGVFNVGQRKRRGTALIPPGWPLRPFPASGEGREEGIKTECLMSDGWIWTPWTARAGRWICLVPA